jgi:preprotein translocase subunit SecB
MNDETKDTNTEAKGNDLPLRVHAQYIKDFSFENPNAPGTLRSGKKGTGAPKMDVNVNLNTRQLDEDNLHEVVLTIEANAKTDEDVLFIAELQYGVVCSVSPDLPSKHVHPLLMIEAPKLAFPFARHILCDAVIAGGYPPMMLNPVDFEGLYLAQYQKEQGKKSNTAN